MSKRKKNAAETALHADDRGLRTAFVRVDHRLFSGFVFDQREPARRFVVELLLDGLPLRLARADDPAPELAAEGIADDRHGFSFMLRDHELDECVAVEARVANQDIAVGQALLLDDAPWVPAADPLGRGQVTWLGGLRFSGWISAGRREGTIEALVEGLPVAQVRASRWTHLTVGGRDPRPLRAFDLHLPERFADGQVHRVSFVDESGAELSGSPLPFIAFADGLERLVVGRSDLETERLRAALFDRLFPRSLPLGGYESWRQRFPLPPPPQYAGRVGVVGLGKGDRSATLKSIEQQSKTKSAVVFLECTDDAFGYAPEALDAFLRGEAANCEALVFCPAGARFAPDALRRLVAALGAHAEIRAAYGDMEITGAQGRPSLLALPAFDYERMLEQGYCARIFAARRTAVLNTAAHKAANPFRLFTALIDKESDPGRAIAHLPVPIARIDVATLAKGAASLASASEEHLAARGLSAQATIPEQGAGTRQMPAVRIARAISRPNVTLIMTTRNGGEAIRATIDAITAEAEETGASILIVDNDSTEIATIALLGTLEKDGARLVRAPGPYNPARLANIGVKAAETSFACLIDGGLESASPGWIGELVSRLQDGAAAAAPLTANSDGTVRGAGLVLGPGLSAVPAFTDHLVGEAGYGDMLVVARECSALSAGCMMMRRNDVLEAGGFDDAAFPRVFHLVDLSFRLQARGRRLIVTPHAKLMFSSGREASSAGVQERELEVLRTRWAERLMSDPYYNPALALDPVPYSALAWPPRNRLARRRLHTPPTSNTIPVRKRIGSAAISGG